ncbi:MAG: PTS transporter subunit IIC [Desulfurococcaceae archaeon]
MSLNVILEAISSAFQTFMGLGASVAIPIVIFFIAVALKVPAGKAARSALTIGIGFVGINLVIGFFINTIAPVTRALVEISGIHLEAIDVGWPSAAAIAYGSIVGISMIPIVLVVNLIALALEVTRTIDIDVWNYWHMAFVASLVYVYTNDYLLGVMAGITMTVALLVIADETGPMIQKMLETPAISLPHGFSAPYAVLAYPFKLLFDRIPGLARLRADPETIRAKLGLLGESPVLGAILGFALSVAARQDYKTVAATTIGLAAVMLLLPRMVRILMEGLVPIADSVRDFFVKRYAGKKEIYIGLDSAIATGHPAVIATSLILIPIFIAEMLVPWNKILLLADLPVIVFMMCMAVPVFNYDIVKSVLFGAIINLLGLWMGTNIMSIYTSTARFVGFPIPAGYVYVSSICDGMNPFTWLLVRISDLGATLGVIVLTILTVLFAIIGRIREKGRAAKALAPA